MKPYHTFDVNSKLIRNFWSISDIMHKTADGKGSQKRILMVLKENREITQRELTEHLGVQPGSASEVLGKLEAAGLIRRTHSQRDRRTFDIRLTEAGEAAAGEAYARRKRRHQEMFGCLSEEEKQTLLQLLEQLNASWSRQYQQWGGIQPGAAVTNDGEEASCGDI